MKVQVLFKRMFPGTKPLLFLPWLHQVSIKYFYKYKIYLQRRGQLFFNKLLKTNIICKYNTVQEIWESLKQNKISSNIIWFLKQLHFLLQVTICKHKLTIKWLVVFTGSRWKKKFKKKKTMKRILHTVVTMIVVKHLLRPVSSKCLRSM